MRMSWKLGRVSGIDIYLHPTFLLILLFPQVTGGGVLGLPLILAAFGCVLLHEFGHALMARRFGIGTEDITLYLIGGVARLSRMPRSPGAELLIALAGPAVNLAIAVGLFGLGILGLFGPYPTASLLGVFTFNLMAINVMLLLFNLIPAFPMDGGRVLRALLSGWIGRLRATETAAGIGRVLAVLFGVYCLFQGMWAQVFLAGFIYMAAGAELASVVAEEHRRRFGTREGNWVAPPGYRWVSRGEGNWQLSPIVVDMNGGNRPGWG
jgi:Zn-dependent protease